MRVCKVCTRCASCGTQAVVEYDGERKEVPIIENGNKIAVTNDLVRKWVCMFFRMNLLNRV
jgi:hypothetical protein